jgi:CarD family transcriptional regulator
MWKVGDYVQHGTDGVCRISDRKRMNLTGEGEEEYFLLTPLYSRDTTIYLETANADKELRQPMSREEIDRVIRQIPGHRMRWIPNEKDRQNRFGAILRDGSLVELLCAASVLRDKKREQTRAGRKFRRSDELCLARAEKIIGREIAYGIGKSPEEVPDYIGKVLEEA